jgi:lipoprotein-releasing system permease protein
MRKKDIISKTMLSKTIIGDIDSFKEDGIIIGQKMASFLNLSIGDNISLISPKGAQTPFGLMPRIKTFNVVGVFNVGMYEYDDNFIFMPLNTAQNFYDLPENEVSYLEITTKNPEDLQSVHLKLALNIGPGTKIITWKQKNSTFINALDVEKNVMFLILTLIILIAGFNVVSSMIMLVKDKNKGIAIMKSMGASKLSILKIFFITGSAIGITGTFFGLVLGIVITDNISKIQHFLNSLTGRDLFSAEIYYLSQLPAKMDYREVIAVVVIALTLSLLSTIYPAWKASKLDPVEALRYE